MKTEEEIRAYLDTYNQPMAGYLSTPEHYTTMRAEINMLKWVLEEE